MYRMYVSLIHPRLSSHLLLVCYLSHHSLFIHSSSVNQVDSSDPKLQGDDRQTSRYRLPLLHLYYEPIHFSWHTQLSLVLASSTGREETL
jgi:hypothetical protein